MLRMEPSCYDIVVFGGGGGVVVLVSCRGGVSMDNARHATTCMHTTVALRG